MTKKADTIAACIMVALGYMIFGTSFFFTDNLLKTTSVIDVLALRFLISFMFFSLLRLLKIIKVDFRNKNVKILLLTAIFEPALYFIFETVGIKHTTTMVGGMIIAFTPVIVVFLESVFLKERATVIQKLFLLLSVAGVFVITAMSQSDGQNSLFGIMCMFLAAVCGASFIVSSRKSTVNFSAIEITYFASMVGAVFFNAICVVNHLFNGTITQYFAPLCNLRNLTGLFVLAILSSFGATTMISFGTGRLQASSVSAFSGLSTITTIIVGVLFNNESLYAYHIIATVMILTGVIGNSYIQTKNAESHQIGKVSF